jgi:hypothetical protein
MPGEIRASNKDNQLCKVIYDHCRLNCYTPNSPVSNPPIFPTAKSVSGPS